MKFGVFFLGTVARGEYRKDYDEIFEQVEYAEELGYDNVWIAEHHSAYGTFGSPALMLSAIAQRTSRIRIGSGVVLLPFHNPVRVAEDYAMVDVLSNGRLNLGVGRGNQRKEYHMMMAKRDESKAVFAEALEIVTRLLSGERVTFHGNHFNFEEVETTPRPIQRPIPISVAAVTRESFLSSAALGYPCMTAEVTDHDEYRDRISQAKELIIKAGVQVDNSQFSYMVETFIAPKKEDAVAAFEDAYFNVFQMVKGINPLGTVPDKDFEYYAKEATQLRSYQTPRELIEGWGSTRTLLVTDPDEAREYVRKLQEIGVGSMVLSTMLGGLDHKKAMASMKLFAEEVMPAFREVTAS